MCDCASQMGKVSLYLAVLLVAVSVCFVSAHYSRNYFYPNIVPGFSNNIYSFRPQIGYSNCWDYWCQSPFNSQYYCCSFQEQEFVNFGYNHGYSNFDSPFVNYGGYRPHTSFGNSYRSYNPYWYSHTTYNPYVSYSSHEHY